MRDGLRRVLSSRPRRLLVVGTVVLSGLTSALALAAAPPAEQTVMTVLAPVLDQLQQLLKGYRLPAFAGRAPLPQGLFVTWDIFWSSRTGATAPPPRLAGEGTMHESSQWPASIGEGALQYLYDSTERADRFYNEQMVDVLTPRMRQFLAAQTWMVLCTADEDGMPSGSPRFGEPGFVVPIDDRTVTWPELRGNGVMTSLGNLVENPKAHLMFPDMSERIGLHLRGATTIVEHDVMCAEHPAVVAAVKTPRPPERWVVLALEVAYMHCRKHFPRTDDQPVEWGTDDVKAKGGDYFGAKDLPKPWQHQD